MEVTLEEIITELVVNGGNAKSKAIEAIRAAKNGNFEAAEEKIKEANESLMQAHEFQTGIIQAEAAGKSAMEVSMIMVHGQDHLMNAITTKDIATEMIDMYRMIFGRKKGEESK